MMRCATISAAALEIAGRELVLFGRERKEHLGDLLAKLEVFVHMRQYIR